MVDLHRHDEFSAFDGFGKAAELAELAKSLGHTSLSVSNHGNTNGLVKHYQACEEHGINCIMGVEAYFQPTINKEKERYHLCLFAKNLKGYENINKLMYRGEKQKHYNPIICFEDLEEFSEGVICTSACVQGFVSKAINNGKISVAEKAVRKFVEIFGDDFYIEIQPYKIDEEGTQERINIELIKIASKLDVKCVLTSDSHYGRKEDFDTYVKMHEIAKHNYDIEATYGERYMPTEKELVDRFVLMHSKSTNGNASWSIDKTLKRAKEMILNLGEIESKVEQGILGKLEEKLPVISDRSYEVMLKKVKEGLKRIGKRDDKEYIARCKKELAVIKKHGFADYFLIVADYVKYAKDKGISVGPGRGSVCNCEVAYLLGITDVDSIKFGLNFERFLREDKKKLPDIDIDFETDRRQEVIDYLIEKYKGHAAQVCSYGLYKTDNLVNDLAKVCGLEDAEEKKALKSYIRSKTDDTYHFDYDENDGFVERYNERYDDIVKHFSKLSNKVRFIGTHAAGVAICGEDIKRYCAIRVSKDKVTGEEREYTCYDLADLEKIKVVKFDMLGLRTMQSLGELRRMTGNKGLTDEMYHDEKIFERFAEGDTDGVFQYEAGTPKRMLQDCHADCFEDIIAVSSMNRPGPLSMKMPEQYAHNKFNLGDVQNSKFYEFTKETYGVIVYQEQLQQICTKVGKLSWADADRLMKLMKQAIATMGDLDKVAEEREDMKRRFVKGAMENGWEKQEAEEAFNGMLKYLFNKGHSVSYGMISLEEMFYKVYYPTEFWYVKMKYCNQSEDAKLAKFKESAVASGALVFLPHVNYTADYCLRKVDGENVIQEGISSIKDVGEKAAQAIEEERRKNGVFVNFDDFYDRCKSRAVTERVIRALKEQGALEFDKKKYISRVKKYNSSLYMRGMKK